MIELVAEVAVDEEDVFSVLRRRYPDEGAPPPVLATRLDWYEIHQIAAGAPAVAQSDTPSAELGPAYRRN